MTAAYCCVRVIVRSARTSLFDEIMEQMVRLNNAADSNEYVRQREARVHVIPMSAPDDMLGMRELRDAGELDAKKLVAVLAKTEGNGCVNDFSRALALRCLRDEVGADRADDVAMVMSGGTEGGMSPHMLTFEVLERSRKCTEMSAAETSSSSSISLAGKKALALGVAITNPIAPEEIGTEKQIASVEYGVLKAMSMSKIESVDDVHFVQVKCPLLTVERIAEAAARGQETRTTDTLKSMGLSRGASALGVACGLGELSRDKAREALLSNDRSIWSSRASTSAGIELMGHEIIVMGNSSHWTGSLAIDHDIMKDAIDTKSVKAAIGRLDSLGFNSVKALLAKAEPSASGMIRGKRHVMLNDSDIAGSRHARALVGGVLSGLVGRTDIFVSGGAEHQGPDGGGTIAVIAEHV